MATNNNILDFEDPGALPKEFMDVPGFVNELKNHTLSVAARPNEPLAFAGAIAMLAHLTGRTYRDEHDGTTGLYLAALAPTGMGKEEPRVTNKRLAAAVGIADSVPDSIASGEALEEAIAENPALLLQCDEADSLLTAMRGSDSRAAKLNEMVLRLFSEAKSCHAMRLTAKDKGRCRIIPNPHLTLFATGIPKFFYSALTTKALENGLLGRCLFIDTEEFKPLGEMNASPLPTDLVDLARQFAVQERRIVETGVLKPIVVHESPDAKRKIAEMKFNCDEITRRLMDSDLGTAAALFVRVPEKALKLALIGAISANPKNPLITAEAVSWATRLTCHLTKRMLYMSQFYVAEGKFDRLKKRFLALLAKAGGQMDRTSLLRSMNIDASTFQKIVMTLHMADMIEEEMLSRRKTIFTLKTAA